MKSVLLSVSVVLTLAACSKVSPELDATADRDGDGYTAAFDCNDTDAAIFPGAEELCNDIDDNCNGAVDDQATDALEWFVDVDGDGVAGTPMLGRFCTQPDGASAEAEDCADLDADRYPGALERCNGLDDNCDGERDEDAGDRVLFFADADGDGHGDAEATVLACAQPPEYVSSDNDCDDTDSTVFPGARERCGPADDDCDGLVDADDPDLDVSTGERFYLDRDADGFGSALFPVFACELPQGASTLDTDCDDLSVNIHPDATELCNERDDDCDGLVDDADDSLDPASGETFYADTDADGFGATDGAVVQACNMPVGFATTADDCDDSTASVAPGVREVCNGGDDDCDGRIDDDDPTLDPTTATRWWTDRDGDGHGGRLFSIVACDQPEGLAPDSDDCNDDNADISPSATEVCDGIDNNCNTLVDDDDTGLDTSTGLPWHPDGDGDGWGASDETVYACIAPVGFGQDTSDCDDTNADISPDSPEICNEIDDNCDGQIDDADDDLTSVGANSWFDEDNDGWGTPDRWSCAPPTFQFAGVVGDCDDSRADVYPDAPELCDNRDNNCNDAVDEDPVDASTFFVDNDRDSFGSDETLVACSQPSNGAIRQGDCDDNRRDVNPDAREVCDTFDNNCNGTVDLDTPNLPSWYVDADADSWGAIGSGVPACSAFDDRISRAGDCDDTLPNVNPGQTEIDDDNLDNDCNGQTDFPTVVSGQVIEDNISWGYADSPPPFDGSLIEVEGNILIAQGATLDIAPCTQIAFADGRALQVEGELIARGEPDCRIVFRSRSLTPSPGDWGRVIFTTSSVGATVDDDGNYESGSILEYVDIMHSGSVGTGALELTGSSGGPVLSNVHIAFSQGRALYATSPVPFIEDSVFEASGSTGIYVGNTNAFRNNQVIGSARDGGRVAATIGTNPVVTGNIVRDNDDDGLELSVSASATVTGNQFINNGRLGLEMRSPPTVFAGNWFIGNQTGLSLETYEQDVLVTGNVFDSQTGGAWDLQEEYFGFDPNDVPEPRLHIVGNIMVNNGGTARVSRGPGAYVTDNLFQGHTNPAAAISFGVDWTTADLIVFEDNAFVGAQTEPWFDVGLRSGADFVDVSNNYWDGREDPGSAINDFLVDPSRTVAAFSPTHDAIPMSVPISYPQDLDASANAGTVTLSWSANPETDVAAYRVWYGLSTDDDWTLRGDGATEGDSGMTVTGTTATLSGLDLSLPWRFSVSAVDTDADGVDDIREGHESWPSPVTIP